MHCIAELGLCGTILEQRETCAKDGEETDGLVVYRTQQ